MPRQMETEPQRIERRSRAQHAVVPQQAYHVGQCVGWIGDHKDQRVSIEAREGGE